MKILIVEDEEALAKGLKFNFEEEGYDVVIADDGNTALQVFHAKDPAVDLVILDLMLPDMSGYEICRVIREIDNQVPILILSARTLSEDKTLAFDCGTDQYMTKPFALPELLSRVRNLLERRRPSPPAGGTEMRDSFDAFEFGEARVDFNKFELTVRGETRTLTKMEMQLLRYFVEHDGIVLSRSKILEDVWGETADIATRTIDNFVLRLRKSIEADPAAPRHILSVWGTGYRFVAAPEE